MFRLCPEEIPAGSYLQLFTLLVIKGFCRKGAESQFLVFLCVHCAYAVKVFHSSSYSCLRVYLPVSLNSDIYPKKIGNSGAPRGRISGCKPHWDWLSHLPYFFKKTDEICLYS